MLVSCEAAGRKSLVLRSPSTPPAPHNGLPVHGIKWSCGNGTEEFSVEQLVQQILDTHPTKPAPRTHACLCSGGLGE